MDVGTRIKLYREKMGLTQEELAKKLGYSGKAAVSRIENAGDHIGTKKIVAFAEALNVTPATLMGWEEDELDTDAVARLMHRYPKLISILDQLGSDNIMMVEEYAEFLLKKAGKA